MTFFKKKNSIEYDWMDFNVKYNTTKCQTSSKISTYKKEI